MPARTYTVQAKRVALQGLVPVGPVEVAAGAQMVLMGPDGHDR